MAEELTHPSAVRHNPPDPEAVEAARDKQLGLPSAPTASSLMSEGLQAEVVDRRVINTRSLR